MVKMTPLLLVRERDSHLARAAVVSAALARLGPGAAYDEAPVRTKEERIKAVLDACVGKLDAQGMMDLKALLERTLDEPDAAMDAPAPAPFPGMPLVGGGQVQLDDMPPDTRARTIDKLIDARGDFVKRFNEKWPEVARVGNDPQGTTFPELQRRKSALTSMATDKAFAERFPDAAAIRTI